MASLSSSASLFDPCGSHSSGVVEWIPMWGEMVQLIALVFKPTKEQPQFKYFQTHTSFADLPVDVGLVALT